MTGPGKAYPGLKKVPGVKHYQALQEGLRRVGVSPGVAAETKKAAQVIARGVASGGSDRGTPKVEGRSVVAGWNNERRSGAAVTLTYDSHRDRVGASRDLARAATPAGPAPRPREPQRKKGGK